MAFSSAHNKLLISVEFPTLTIFPFAMYILLGSIFLYIILLSWNDLIHRHICVKNSSMLYSLK